MAFVFTKGAYVRERRDILFGIHWTQREGAIVRLTFSAALLRAMHWEAGQRLALGLGTGDDAHWIELRASADAGPALRRQPRGSRLFWSTAAPAAWPERLRACKPFSQLSADGAALRILLPWQSEKAGRPMVAQHQIARAAHGSVAPEIAAAPPTPQSRGAERP